MMKIALLVLATIATGCYGSQMSAMDTRMVQMERENVSLRRQNAQLQKQERIPETISPAASIPTPTPAPAARAWTRQAHGQYLCIVDYDAHISLADRVRFENKVDKFSKRPNSWVSFTLNGQPVAIVRSTLRGPSVQYQLAPNEVCYVELGGADNYKVIASLHKNKGSYQMPVLVPTHRQMTHQWDVGPDDDELPFVFQKYQF